MKTDKINKKEDKSIKRASIAVTISYKKKQKDKNDHRTS